MLPASLHTIPSVQGPVKAVTVLRASGEHDKDLLNTITLLIEKDEQVILYRGQYIMQANSYVTCRTNWSHAFVCRNSMF